MHLDFDKLFLGLTNSFLEYSESLRKLKNNAVFYIVNTHLQPFKGKIFEIIIIIFKPGWQYASASGLTF